MYRHTLLLLFFVIASYAVFAQPRVMKATVYFKVDQAALDTAAVRTLCTSLDSLCNADILRVVLKGNADNTGSDSEYNMQLSQKRADTVRRFIRATGVSQRVISEAFFGEQKPVADNNTEEGRQLNRRVEVLISYEPKKIVRTDTADDLSMRVKARKKDLPPLPDTVIARRNNRNYWCCWGNWCMGCAGVQSLECWQIVRRTDSLNPPDRDSLIVTVNDSVSILDFGTFKVDTLPGCYRRDSTKCFSYPFYVYIPVSKNMLKVKEMLKTAAIYAQDSDGIWRFYSNEVDLMRRDGKDYLALNIKCPYRWMSCRIINPTDATVHIKVPRGYTVSSIRTEYDRPGIVSVGVSESPRVLQAHLIHVNAPGRFIATLKDRKGKNYSFDLPVSAVIRQKYLTPLFRSAKPGVKRKVNYRVRPRSIQEAGPVQQKTIKPASV